MRATGLYDESLVRGLWHAKHRSPCRDEIVLTVLADGKWHTTGSVVSQIEKSTVREYFLATFGGGQASLYPKIFSTLQVLTRDGYVERADGPRQRKSRMFQQGPPGPVAVWRRVRPFTGGLADPLVYATHARARLFHLHGDVVEWLLS